MARKATLGPPAGFIVTPGASATRDHVTLVALEAGLPEIAVERLTLGTTSVKRAASIIVEAATALADRLGVTPAEIALGGRSFGGRSCSLSATRCTPRVNPTSCGSSTSRRSQRRPCWCPARRTPSEAQLSLAPTCQQSRPQRPSSGLPAIIRRRTRSLRSFRSSERSGDCEHTRR